MMRDYETFRKLMNENNRVEVYAFIQTLLKSKTYSIEMIYTEFLLTYLRSIDETMSNPGYIWDEHIKSSIIRSIVEICSTNVYLENNPNGKTVFVLCPEGELHDLPGRMATDVLYLGGMNATFVGANMPKEQLYKVLESVRPEAVLISVTDSYSISETVKMIKIIRSILGSTIKIFVAGHAFDNNPHILKQLMIDGYIANFQELHKVGE